jgi:hypothetical protein
LDAGGIWRRILTNQPDGFRIVNQKKLFIDSGSVTGEKNIAKIMQNRLYLFTSKFRWL